MPLRQARFVVRHYADKHNFLTEQGDAVLETGSVVEILMGSLRLHKAVSSPLVFYKLPEGATDYTRSLAYRLDDGTYAQPSEIMKVLYKAPATVHRQQVTDLVEATWTPVKFDEAGTILVEDLALLHLLGGDIPKDQLGDGRKLRAASQELLANEFVVKAMEYLTLGLYLGHSA